MAACFFLNGEHSEGNAVVDSCRVPNPVSGSLQVLPCWNSLSEFHYMVDIWNGFRCPRTVVPVLEWEDDHLSSAVW